ncbi:alpha/beta hydrolase [Ramlibacter sp. AW1]|uniref:Alpha/beta hydrolase n=1 Tax=Ramlibacter aurantiacus TaxID=2801330 RepID=A0A936ZLW3_9BURK|nr:alpha/beta hydrolase [Ramlibacter aurantiacus]MBL0420091.1 alpha/beta hydrolase [Ramlibacter aurantiacus]
MERPTLVMLPGLLCDDAVWAPQQQALAGAPCFIPDYGLASSITQMARLVLEQAPAERFALAGHSMGGRVALEMARLAPARIQRIALLDTGYEARQPGDAGDAEQRKRLALLEIARTRGMREMAREWAVGMVHPDRLDTPVFEAVLDMVARKTPEVFAAQIEALLHRPDATPVLQGLRCPTLLACGRQDAWSPLQRHEEMQALVPGSRLVVIENSGHMSTMEQPEAVSAALREWLVD